MITTKRPKTVCVSCGEIAGAFLCQGCGQPFCLHHSNEHRQDLEQQMNETTDHYIRLKEHVNSRRTDRHRQTLMKEIDDWEEQSIEQIHRLASDTRQQLLQLTREKSNYITETLAQLTQQLKKAQYDGNYFESELKRWTTAVQELQNTILEQESIQIYRTNANNTFVPRISLLEPTENNPLQHLRYEPNLNMQGAYSSGNHLLRFRLDEYDTGSWVLVGIIARSSAKTADPLRNSTFYGWSSNNLVYLRGSTYCNYNDYQSDIEKGDIFQLILDCDRHFIQLTNERTRCSYDLGVDINKCSFPWQPHVRLLSASK